MLDPYSDLSDLSIATPTRGPFLYHNQEVLNSEERRALNPGAKLCNKHRTPPTHGSMFRI